MLSRPVGLGDKLDLLARILEGKPDLRAAFLALWTEAVRDGLTMREEKQAKEDVIFFTDGILTVAGHLVPVAIGMLLSSPYRPLVGSPALFVVKCAWIKAIPYVVRVLYV